MKRLIVYFLLFLHFRAAANDTTLFVIVEQEQFGYINKKGEMVIKPVFRYGGDFHEGLAAARLDGLFGYIDTRGTFVIEPQFDFAEDFKSGKAYVVQGEERYMIDKNGYQVGSIVRKTEYIRRTFQVCGEPNPDDYKDDYWRQNPQPKNEESLTKKFKERLYFIRNRALVKHEGFYMCIDTSGNFLANIKVPIHPDSTLYLRDGYIEWVATRTREAYKAWDLDGNILSDYPKGYDNDVVVSRMESGQYLFTYEGIDFGFEGEGAAALSDFTKYYYYRVRNSLHTPFYPERYDDVEKTGFSNGLLMVQYKDKLSYIDTTGRVVWRQKEVVDTSRHSFNYDFVLHSNWGWCHLGKPDTFSGNPFGLKEMGINIKAFPEEKAVFNHHIEGVKVRLINYSDYIEDTIRIRNNLFITVEVSDGKEGWLELERFNDWHREFTNHALLKIPSGHYWTFVFPKYTGSKKVKMRFVSHSPWMLISEPFDAYINPAQLWRNVYKPKYRLVDRFLSQSITNYNSNLGK
jgi:hypothetical protein